MKVSKLTKLLSKLTKYKKKRKVAPNLPEEIVVIILSFLHDPTDTRCRLDLLILECGRPPYVSLTPAARTVISKGIQLLCGYSSISRIWRIATLPILYRSVVLVSLHQAQLFARTLESTPEFSRMVKEMVIMITPQPQPSRRFKLPTRSRNPTLVVLFGDSCPDYPLITSIVKSCRSLESVHVRLPHRVLASPSFGVFTPSIERLRLSKLVIHGHVMFDTIAPEKFSDFPCLEILCLHQAKIGVRFMFPCLPRLHTLQLINTTIWCMHLPLSPAFQILMPDRLPSLRSMHFHGTIMIDGSFRAQVNHYFPRLTNISASELCDVSGFSILSKSSALSSLEHLAIGRMDRFNHPLSSWHLPPSLRSLTILLDMARPLCHLSPLLDFLTVNESAIFAGPSSLRQVSVFAYWRGDWDAEAFTLALMGLPLADLKQRCALLGVEMLVRLIG